MLENTQKIAKSFTIFEKSTLMHTTVACMEGLKHALLSPPLKRATPNPFVHPFLKFIRLPLYNIYPAPFCFKTAKN